MLCVTEGRQKNGDKRDTMSNHGSLRIDFEQRTYRLERCRPILRAPTENAAASKAAGHYQFAAYQRSIGKSPDIPSHEESHDGSGNELTTFALISPSGIRR